VIEQLSWFLGSLEGLYITAMHDYMQKPAKQKSKMFSNLTIYQRKIEHSFEIRFIPCIYGDITKLTTIF